MPVILGTNKAEGILFVYEWPRKLWDFEYVAAIVAIFKDKSTEVLEVYPGKPFADNRNLLSQVFTDYLFTCPSRQVAQYLFPTQKDTYFYIFDAIMSFDPWGPNYSFCVDECCHGEELMYVFNSAESNGYQFTNKEEQLSRTLTNYWSSFAQSRGDPNAKHMCEGALFPPVAWPQFDELLNYIQFRQSLTMTVQNLSPETVNCDFWNSLGYSF